MKGNKDTQKSFIVKEINGFDIRQIVRKCIIPEITEAVKDRNFADGLKAALGLKEAKK